MKKLMFALLSAFACIFCACDTPIIKPAPTEAAVSLLVGVNYDSTSLSPLVYLQTYPYGSTSNVRWSRLSFFLTNVVLTDANGKEVLAAESIFIDCSSFVDAATGKNGLALKTDVIPFGKYTKITFTVGVTNALNAKKPSNFALSSALSNTDMYWDSWQSYIFSKIEGTLDKNKDGIFETGVTIHAGGEKVAQTRTLPLNLTFENGGNNTVNLGFTFTDLLKSIDLNSITQTHQLSDVPTMKTLVNNIADAIKVK
jgi:hypothetical protein